MPDHHPHVGGVCPATLGFEPWCRRTVRSVTPTRPLSRLRSPESGERSLEQRAKARRPGRSRRARRAPCQSIGARRLAGRSRVAPRTRSESGEPGYAPSGLGGQGDAVVVFTLARVRESGHSTIALPSGRLRTQSFFRAGRPGVDGERAARRDTALLLHSGPRCSERRLVLCPRALAVTDSTRWNTGEVCR